MSDTLRALRERIAALPYAAVLLSDVLALVDAALLDAAARAPQEVICGNGYHFADDGAASCACGARAVSPVARAEAPRAETNWMERCVCGHALGAHVFKMDCRVEACACMEFQSSGLPAAPEQP